MMTYVVCESFICCLLEICLLGIRLLEICLLEICLLEICLLEFVCWICLSAGDLSARDLSAGDLSALLETLSAGDVSGCWARLLGPAAGPIEEFQSKLEHIRPLCHQSASPAAVARRLACPPPRRRTRN